MWEEFIHLLAGGIAGTTGAIVTCPLEVVKTRLQSSVVSFNEPTGKQVSAVSYLHGKQSLISAVGNGKINSLQWSPASPASASKQPSIGIRECLKHIIATEGHKALFKGLGANIIGVFPTRAIYFCSYSSAKKFLNQRLTPDTTLVFIGSSMCAGFMSSTLTNPIWIVKTRLQLCQRSNGRFTVKECIKSIYEKGGIPGFWKGISASYIGTSETVIHFVIYEALKAKLKEYHGYTSNERTYWDFVELMLAAATSKSCASLVAYPHEVVRTRLRQEGNKYTSFKQTILTVFREEGYAGLYRGLWTQFVRQIPNTAIVMTTYESVIYLHEVYSTENDYDDN